MLLIHQTLGVDPQKPCVDPPNPGVDPPKPGVDPSNHGVDPPHVLPPSATFCTEPVDVSEKWPA